MLNKVLLQTCQWFSHIWQKVTNIWKVILFWPAISFFSLLHVVSPKFGAFFILQTFFNVYCLMKGWSGLKIWLRQSRVKQTKQAQKHPQPTRKVLSMVDDLFFPNACPSPPLSRVLSNWISKVSVDDLTHVLHLHSGYVFSISVRCFSHTLSGWTVIAEASMSLNLNNLTNWQCGLTKNIYLLKCCVGGKATEYTHRLESSFLKCLLLMTKITNLTGALELFWNGDFQLLYSCFGAYNKTEMLLKTL